MNDINLPFAITCTLKYHLKCSVLLLSIDGNQNWGLKLIIPLPFVGIGDFPPQIPVPNICCHFVCFHGNKVLVNIW